MSFQRSLLDQGSKACANPKSDQKKTDNLSVFIALSGSARVKAPHRILMKLTPEVDKSNLKTILNELSCRLIATIVSGSLSRARHLKTSP